MRCNACGNPTPSGARFCARCGVALVGACRQCGGELSEGARYCHRCGHAASAPDAARAPSPRSYTPKHLAERILGSRSALIGERKQVTVLFVDVKGSLELAAQVDPEHWHRILDGFFRILTDGVHRFEGTVNQYTGDGIMALFGAPIAHEDHAARACHAALHLGERLRRYANELRLARGLNFSVRMGLNSGEVVVGSIGDDLRMDYTAQGHTVGLAARMEQIAEAGRIYLTEHTARLVEGLFALDDLGEMEVKGAPRPLGVHALAGAGPLRTRLDVSRARGFARFVGREAELAALEQALDRARRGRGEVLAVAGEAGVGKSRLCYEFAERCRGAGVEVWEAHCSTAGKGVPLSPIRALLGGLLSVGAEDGVRAVREKVAGRLLLLDRSLADDLPLVFELLGVADAEAAPALEPEERCRHLASVLGHLLQARGPAEPSVLMIDDLHWIDAESDVVLAQLGGDIDATPTLLVVNFRPEHHCDWIDPSRHSRLGLAPLAFEAADILLTELLGTDGSTAELRERIHERANGNPLFVEELVRSLAASGTLAGGRGEYRLADAGAAFELPATVQAVLAARIDALADGPKQALQVAAVVGKRFEGGVLVRALEALEALPESGGWQPVIGALEDAELVRTDGDGYVFQHPLAQEVAYQSQLAERRRRIHAEVARALQQEYADRLGEKAPWIAQHWAAADYSYEAARWRRFALLQVKQIQLRRRPR